MMEPDVTSYAEALRSEPRLDELLAAAGPDGAELLATCAAQFVHDGYVSRRAIVDRMSLEDPHVLGDQVRRPSMLEAHAVADIVERVLAEHHAALMADEATVEHEPGEITSRTVEVRVEAEALALHADKVVELIERGIIVRIVRGDHVIADVMPVR